MADESSDEVLPGIACAWKSCIGLFHSITDLRNHVSADHLKYFPYSCPVCSFARFPTQETLAEHIQICHPGKESPKASIDFDDEKTDALDKCIWESINKDSGVSSPAAHDNNKATTAKIVAAKCDNSACSGRNGTANAKIRTLEGTLRRDSSVPAACAETAFNQKFSRKRKITVDTVTISVSAKDAGGQRVAEDQEDGGAEYKDPPETGPIASPDNFLCHQCMKSIPGMNDQSARLHHVFKKHLDRNVKFLGCPLCDYENYGHSANMNRHIRNIHKTTDQSGIIHGKWKDAVDVTYRQCFPGSDLNLVNSDAPKLSSSTLKAPRQLPEKGQVDSGSEKRLETRQEAGKGFFCEVCRMYSSEAVRRHIYSKHLMVKVMKCSECEYGHYYSSNTVKMHIARKHGDIPDAVVEDFKGDYEDDVQQLMDQCFPGYKEKVCTGDRHKKVRMSNSGSEGDALMNELAAASPVRVKIEATPGRQRDQDDDDDDLMIIEENY